MKERNIFIGILIIAIIAIGVIAYRAAYKGDMRPIRVVVPATSQSPAGSPAAAPAPIPVSSY